MRRSSYEVLRTEYDELSSPAGSVVGKFLARLHQVPERSLDRRRTQSDPEQSFRVLRSSHRNRLKPPFRLRQRGTSTVSDGACKGRQGSRLPAAQHCGRSQAPSTCRPRFAVPDRLACEFDQRIAVSPRPSTARRVRCRAIGVPAAAGARRISFTREQRPHPGLPLLQRHLITPSFPSLRVSHDVPGCSRLRIGDLGSTTPRCPRPSPPDARGTAATVAAQLPRRVNRSVATP